MVPIHSPPRDGSLVVSGSRASASALDHALTLLLADETEAALRWSAAILDRAPLHATALVITSRLLDQMGRTRAAIDGLRLAVRRAIETGNLPLAVVAIDDLRVLGADPREAIERVATAFARGSPRLHGDGPPPGPQPPGDFLEPLSPFLAGPPLASRATQVVFAAKQAHDAALVGAEPTPLAQWPLFSALTKDALSDLLGAFNGKTLPAGHRVIEEGEEGDAAYIVVQGEVEISRRAAPGDHKPRLAVATLGPGAFFGEMALLSRLPSTTFATTTRPTILLVGKRDALAGLAARRPELAIQLAAHCRRNSLENLGWTSAVVATIPHDERAALVERLQMRIFERGEKLMREREEAKGLHLVISGEVAIVGREWSERVLLATLGPGETVGEVELVLCRQAYADAIAMRPTAALFLSKEEYTAIVQDRPSVLHGLYATAIRRNAETRLALDTGSAVIADEWLVEEEQTETHVLPSEDSPVRVLPPRPHATSRVVIPPPLPVQSAPSPVQPAPAPASHSSREPRAEEPPPASVTPVAPRAAPLPSMAPRRARRSVLRSRPRARAASRRSTSRPEARSSRAPRGSAPSSSRGTRAAVCGTKSRSRRRPAPRRPPCRRPERRRPRRPRLPPRWRRRLRRPRLRPPRRGPPSLGRRRPSRPGIAVGPEGRPARAKVCVVRPAHAGPVRAVRPIAPARPGRSRPR